MIPIMEKMEIHTIQCFFLYKKGLFMDQYICVLFVFAGNGDFR